MSNWTTDTIQRSGITIRVHRPDLSPAERAKRMKEIEKAATNLIMAAERKRTA